MSKYLSESARPKSSSSYSTCEILVNVKRETEDEELKPVEHLDLDLGLNIKEEIKMEELILDDEMTASDTLYKCQHCCISFNMPEYLRRHEKTHKVISKALVRLYGCNFCIKTFNSSKKLENHLLIHQPKASYDCISCGKTCQTASDLKVHQQTHSKTKPKPQSHTCDYCGKSFSEKYNLTVHVRSHTGMKPYECETCGKKFTTNPALTVHRRTHSGERPYECSVCHNRFTTSSYLSEHNRYHRDECPFACDVCPKKFKTAKLLKSHKSVHDPDVDLIECKLCGKILKSQTSKRAHDREYCPKEPQYTNEFMKQVGEKKIVVLACQICCKEFIGKYRRAGLQRHMRLHTKIQPYKCEECNKCFSDWTGWKSHTRTHTSEKPYHCLQCDLYFKSQNYLSRHFLNVHKLGKIRLLEKKSVSKMEKNNMPTRPI